MNKKLLVETELAGETKVLRRNLPQCHSCPLQIPRDLGSNQGCHSGKPATNPLSYGTTLLLTSHSALWNWLLQFWWTRFNTCSIKKMIKHIKSI
jgi:hypothetical protein